MSKKPPFTVVCDETNNTPETMAMGVITATVTLEPAAFGLTLIDELNPDAFTAFEKPPARKRKNATTDSIALVACNNGVGVILDYNGPGIESDFDAESSPSLDCHSLDDAPDGLSIWEGRLTAEHTSYEYPLEHDVVARGAFRDLTTAEWILYRSTGCPWEYDERAVGIMPITKNDVLVNVHLLKKLTLENKTSDMNRLLYDLAIKKTAGIIAAAWAYCEDNTELVGWAVAERWKPQLDWKERRAIEVRTILSVFVAPAFRGRGIGRKLVKVVSERALQDFPDTRFTVSFETGLWNRMRPPLPLLPEDPK